MQPILTPQSFTSEGPGIQNVLLTPACVRPAFDPSTTEDHLRPVGCEVAAIWDTGATGSVISQRVVDNCALKPIGMQKVRGVHGEGVSPVYLVNLEIPPNTGFPALNVTLGDLGKEIDLLIGMDVINRGDFVVTNFNGKTVFSFRCPSVERIDFVDPKARQTLISGVPKVGRNDRCPCGSGQKYKRCHGAGLG
ncbi:MAG: SEC-C metal-binding domain-containing protein [Chthoniobacterales bacterium]